MYVTDTHGFLWYISMDKRLSRDAREIFEKCDNNEVTIIIPTIVLIEAIFICERKININFDDVLLRIRLSSNYLTYPLDDKVVSECTKSQLTNPHDRIIVATAKLLNAQLITKDEEIRKSGLVETVW